MTKAQWGLKRTCQSCGAKFYDMRRSPIVCPKCGTPFDPEAVLRARRSKMAGAKPAPEDEAADEAEVAIDPADKDEDEDEVIEDTSELGGDAEDVDDVVDGTEERREDR